MIEESICDGDFVIVLRRHQAESGEMVVARVGGEDTIKRYYREGVMVRHPCLRALRFPADQVQIKGIVVDLMRKF
jgi:repressor LexA